jgi:hypothetical protein
VISSSITTLPEIGSLEFVVEHDATKRSKKRNLKGISIKKLAIDTPLGLITNGMFDT